jgi:hypothetical protein
VAGLHLSIFMDIRSSVCGMFEYFKLFYAIYQVILVAILPPVLMSTFGFLIGQSLRQRDGTRAHARQKDRDLMRLLIAELMINILHEFRIRLILFMLQPHFLLSIKVLNDLKSNHLSHSSLNF